MSTMFETFHRELHDAGMQAYEVVRIRVTADAISGAPVAMPLTPERARSVKLPERHGWPVPLELVRRSSCTRTTGGTCWSTRRSAASSPPTAADLRPASTAFPS